MALTRRRLVVLSSAAVLLIIGVLAAGFVASVTQTSYGRGLIRDYVQNVLTKKVKGRIYVGRIGGSLFGGLTIDSVEIRDLDDSIFVATGKVTVAYDPRDLIDKRVLISRLEVEHPVINMTQDTAGHWNFKKLFPSGPPKAPDASGGFGRFVVIEKAAAHDASFTLRMPWNPPDSVLGEPISRARQRAIVDSVLRDSTNHITVMGKEGPVRVWHWRKGDLATDYVRLANPDTAGRYFRIASLSVEESDPPLPFHGVRGEVRWLGDSIWLNVPHFDLPASTGSAKGKVVWGSDLPVRYDIAIQGDSVSLSDVAWVYPTLPRTGGGSMRLHIGNERNLHVIDYAITRMDVRSTGSRLRGQMTYGVGGQILVVKDVDLDADPMDFALIRTLNGKPFPYPWAGTIAGHVKARGGPLTNFVVDQSAFTFRDANVPGAVTIGSAKGGLNILEPAFTKFLGLDVHVAQLDLRTPQFLNPNFPRVKGYVSGTATLDSSWLDVRFSNADLRHVDGAGEPSHVTGSGRVTYGEKFLTYDLDLAASPVAFTTLAQSYPLLALRGDFEGPIRVRGTMEDLDVATVLTGRAGTIAVSGNFDLDPPGGMRARARGNLTGIDLRALLDRATIPTSRLTMRVDADLTGDSLRTLAGTLGVDVDRSVLDGVRVYPSVARLVFDRGHLRVDSLRLESSAASLLASGGLGLAPGRGDSLRVSVVVDSLGGLRRWLASAPAQVASAGSSLLDAPATDSLGGTLRFDGALAGTIDSLALGGRMAGRELVWGKSSVRGVTGSVAVGDLTHVPRGLATIELDTIRAGGVGLTRATAQVALLDRGLFRFTSALASASGPRAGAAGTVRVSGDTTALALDSLALETDSSRWGLVAPVHVASTASGTVLDSLVVRGSRSGRLALTGSFPRREPVSLLFVADSVPLADVGALVQSKVPLHGTARLEWRAEGLRERPAMRFTAALRDARFGGMSLEYVNATGSYAERRLDAGLALYHSGSPALRATGSFPLDLSLVPVSRRVLGDSLRANVRSDSVTLGIIEALSPKFRRATGTLSANVDVRGTFQRPAFSGALTVVNGAVGLPDLGIRLDRTFADLAFTGDSLFIRRLTTRSGAQAGDTLSLTGVVDVRELFTDPGFDLRLYLNDFHAVSRTRVADVTLSTPRPGLRLTGRLARSALTGSVVVPRGEIYIPELVQKRVVSLDDPDLANIVDTSVFSNRSLLPSAPSRLVQGLDLRNVRIGMGEDVWLRSSEANIKLGGEVNVTTARATGGEDTTQARLALEGAITADRGTYRLSLGLVQRTFVVEQQGSLRFFGDADLNPTLDISAAYNVRQSSQADQRQDVKIVVHIGGTLARPVLELSSPDTRLSQSDLISYLVTGQPSFAVGGWGENSSLLGNALLPSLGSYLGGRIPLGVDVVEVQTTGNAQDLLASNSARNLGSSLFAGTRLGVGKQIGDRWFVSANTGLCGVGEALSGNNQGLSPSSLGESLGIKAELRLPSSFSLSLGSEPSTSALFCSSTGNLNARGFVPTPRQYGFDLFKTWQF